MATYELTITIDDDWTDAETPLETVEDYMTRVINMAVRSYKAQHGETTIEGAIMAAAADYNDSLPEPAPEPEPESDEEEA